MDSLDIHQRLDAELAGSTAPPIGSLVTDAVAAGRRMRRRRRIAAGVGITAGVAVLVATGVAAASALLPGPATQPGLAPAAQPTAAATSSTAPPPPTASTDPAEAALLERLQGVIPAGSVVHDARVNTDDYGSTISFTLVNGGATGQVVVGVLQGADDSARYVCHTSDGECQVSAAGAAAAARSLYLPGGELRVDALLGPPDGRITVFVEADPDVLTREEGIAIATSLVWIEG